MKKHLILGLLLLLPWPVAAQIIQPGIIPGIMGCDYYAAPSASGGSSSNDGRFPSTPFRIEDFWGVAQPGDVLCLLNGTYRGDADMIDPPASVNGTGSASNWPPDDGEIVTGSSPVTVRALRDGGVLVDGEFARTPVSLNSNDWFVIEGINARNSTHTVYSIDSGASNNIIRRSIGWDAHIGKNNYILGYHGGTNLLAEDFAAFGTARKPISNSQGGDTFTCRRCLSRWEGSTRRDAKMSFSMLYNSTGGICENCIALWSGEQMPYRYCVTSASDGVTCHTEACDDNRSFAHEPPSTMTGYWICSTRGALSMDRNDGASVTRTVEIYGSMGLTFSTDRSLFPAPVRFNGARSSDGPVDILLSHVLAYQEQSANNGVFFFRDELGTSDLDADHLTSIRTLGDSIGAGWVLTNDLRVTSQGSYSPWTNSLSADGANLCNKYINGTRTSQPLWPWPMNERIKAATGSAGGYSGPVPDICTDSDGSACSFPNRTPLDLTALIESKLGTIPASCRN